MVDPRRLTPGEREEKPDKIFTEEDIIDSVEAMAENFHRAMSDVIAALNEETKRRAKKQADYMLKLELAGIKVTDEDRIKRLQEYEKKRVQQTLASQKEINDQLMQEIKSYGKSGKEQAKEAEKKKKENERLNKVLNEIASKLSKSTELEKEGKDKEAAQLKKEADKLADSALKDERQRQFLSEFKNNVKDQLGKTVSAIANLGTALSSEVNRVIDMYSKYYSSVNTRLQGTNKTFFELEKTIRGNIGLANPFVRAQSVMENMNALVSQGIATNIEQRAFLGGLSEKIATTFEYNNETLLRLARLQRIDSTGLRLGMEASINRFLNANFQNTEYLNQTFNNVSAALLEASSQMGPEEAVSFEASIHKWLGSLVSLGMSDSTATTLASALGALSAGDINALQSNQFNSLLTLAASRSGEDYADLIIHSLDESKTNKLLIEVVGFLKEISMSSNQVLKSQYAQTFGLTLSDLRAIQNINTNQLQLESIKDTTFTPRNMEAYLAQMAGSVLKRTSFADMLKIAMDNVMFSTSANIANNPLTLGIWELAEILEKTMGGLKIPTIHVLGFGIDLGTVSGLLKTGTVGMGFMSSIMESLTNGILGKPILGLSPSRVFDAFGGATPQEGVRTSLSKNYDVDFLSSETQFGSKRVDSKTQAQNIKEQLKLEDKEPENPSAAILSLMSNEEGGGVFKSIIDPLGYTADTIESLLGSLGGFVESVGTSVGEASKGIGEGLGSIASGIGSGIGDVIDAIMGNNAPTDSLEDYQSSSLFYLQAINTGIIGIQDRFGPIRVGLEAIAAHYGYVPGSTVITLTPEGTGVKKETEIPQGGVVNLEDEITPIETGESDSKKQITLLREILSKLDLIERNTDNFSPGLGG